MRTSLQVAFLCLFLPLTASAQYIDTVWSYLPAPGQFINTPTGGQPRSVFSICDGVSGLLSLGAFGGSVVFSFDRPVENHPDHPFGVDFSIFGNALPDWSEPGVVWVMKDENQNGLPDDQWYALAGSDYFFSHTQTGYRVTYYNPGGDEARDVPWTSTSGDSASIRTNAAHTQSYYPLPDSFPSIGSDSFSLEGIRISGMRDDRNPIRERSLHRAFGYADNRLRGKAPYDYPDNPYTLERENAGGDAFDISWAVDSSGRYVDLDEIHFVKVQSAMQADGGWLGEVSTEITGAVLVSPSPGWEGCMEILLIRDLPLQIDTGRHQLELFYFSNGRLQALPEVDWTVSQGDAKVDEHLVLSVLSEGELQLRASLRSNPDIFADAITSVVAPTRIHSFGSDKAIAVYPNPLTDVLYVRGASGRGLALYSLSGICLKQFRPQTSPALLDLSDLPSGVYIVSIDGAAGTHRIKVIKR
ncbi:MAG: hypothetical protein CSA96_07000 [Bacteroidetes bacterium]|nr:MAG: hypothetical protein CSA96_07000 [Bacteroidota bacterium]